MTSLTLFQMNGGAVASLRDARRQRYFAGRRLAHLLFSLLFALILIGCTTSEDVAKAEQYKLELQYYQYAIDFAGKGMVSEAVSRCEQTALLRNECMISFVQIQMRQGMTPLREHCESINPAYRINMTNRALGVVYRDLDKELADELKTKMRPTPERVAAIQSIKEECLAST